MKKDEIIVLLKEQLQLANEQLQQANATVSSLTTQVNELIERIKSLEELLVQKGIAIDKANRQNKALGKLVSGKKSERQEKNPQASMTQEEFDKKKEELSILLIHSSLNIILCAYRLSRFLYLILFRQIPLMMADSVLYGILHCLLWGSKNGNSKVPRSSRF